MSNKTFEPGDRVKLTGRFLRNTGQLAGGEGRKVWTVIDCACRLCGPRYVAVDEESSGNPGQPRHIASVNLQKSRR